jgi:hypothetical protein
MNRTFKRSAATTVVGEMAVGGALLAGGTTDAMPSDQPCGVSDVHITVTPDNEHAAGQEAYVLTYTAAAPTTNCRLEGVPTAVSFVSGGQNYGSGVTVVPDAPAAPPSP